MQPPTLPNGGADRNIWSWISCDSSLSEVWADAASSESLLM